MTTNMFDLMQIPKISISKSVVLETWINKSSREFTDLDNSNK